VDGGGGGGGSLKFIFQATLQEELISCDPCSGQAIAPTATSSSQVNGWKKRRFFCAADRPWGVPRLRHGVVLISGDWPVMRREW
jgi:hypothetical protein